MAIHDIKARLALQMQGIAGMGKVYNRMRLIRDAGVEKTGLVSNGVLNAWFVTRDASSLADQAVNQGLTEQKDTISIHGFYAVADAVNAQGLDSESMMDALADAVIAAVNADRRPPSRLGGTVSTAGPPELKMSDLRHFGPSAVLCHHVQITLTVMRELP